MTRPTKKYVSPSKTQNGLSIHPFLVVFGELKLSLCSANKDHDQTGWMLKLMCVFTASRPFFFGFSRRLVSGTGVIL